MLYLAATAAASRSHFLRSTVTQSQQALEEADGDWRLALLNIVDGAEAEASVGGGGGGGGGGKGRGDEGEGGEGGAGDDVEEYDIEHAVSTYTEPFLPEPTDDGWLGPPPQSPSEPLRSVSEPQPRIVQRRFSEALPRRPSALDPIILPTTASPKLGQTTSSRAHAARIRLISGRQSFWSTSPIDVTSSGDGHARHLSGPSVPGSLSVDVGDGQLEKGARVFHEVRGWGKIVEFSPRDTRDKPYRVQFDNGEAHSYSRASAAKLKPRPWARPPLMRQRSLSTPTARSGLSTPTGPLTPTKRSRGSWTSLTASDSDDAYLSAEEMDDHPGCA